MIETELDALAPKKARVEIIPLIDVVFFLLATFVLFTLSLTKTNALDTILPKAGPPGDGPDTTVYLQASDPGTFYWKQGRTGAPELISASEVAPRLLDYRRHTPGARVFVRGDDKAHFGPAVFLLDQARLAGIADVSIETATSASGR